MSKLTDSLRVIRGLDKLPSETLARVNKEIRKRAIKRVQKDIIKNPKPVEDYTEEQIETLTADAEKEIRLDIAKGGFKAVLVMLGLSLFI
tara:strand:- start:494 stop:763 length:270 start_codon:yes stop_codon:yes gene_type:complete